MRYSRSLVAVAVAAALTVPVWSSAQTAVPRNGGSSGGGSSAGSSGGGGGEAVSRGSGGDSSRAPAPFIPSFPTDSRRPSSSSTRSGGESTTRGGGSGDSSVGPGTVRNGSAVTRGGNVAGAGSGNTYVGSRSRDGRPQVGNAMERPYSPTPNYNLYFPNDPFSPWGRWYPWYYGGFGYGYVSFDPWRYGASRYSLYRYGSWYNPYDPWCFGVGYWLCDPWGGAATSSYGGGSSSSSRDEDPDAEPTGTLRLRVSPATAKVYVDGALVGTVGDFDGLGGHLKLTVAPHLIEIKADGYETFTPKVEVQPGKTLTVRGSLKKIQ